MKKLIALTFVLYLSHQYKPGDELPANNQEMVEAWVEAGSAIWKDVSTEEKGTAKAKPATAQAGQTGTAIPAEGEDNLAGKVPETLARKKTK
jgi:hypothetical protein